MKKEIKIFVGTFYGISAGNCGYLSVKKGWLYTEKKLSPIIPINQSNFTVTTLDYGETEQDDLSFRYINDKIIYQIGVHR